MRKITKIIIHCSDSDFGCAGVIDDWHRDRGWDLIGYHYVIGNGLSSDYETYDQLIDGNIEAGRPLSIIGAHAYGHNKDSIGICLIGRDQFTIRQLRALKDLVQYLQGKYDIGSVIGHKELNNKKTCPNMDMELLRAYIASEDDTWPLFNLMESMKGGGNERD